MTTAASHENHESGEAGEPSNPWAAAVATEANNDVAPRRAELHRLAGAARSMIDRLVATDAPVEVLAAAADDLEAAADRFRGYHQGSLYEGFAEAANSGGDAAPMFDHSPLLGKGNPIAPPIHLEILERMVRARVCFGAAYEGPPGCVHGGFIAAAFDEVLGSAQALSGQPGMTGTLTIRYENPTPLHTDLRIEAELEGVEGRKVFTVGRLFAGDVLTARAQGVFISIGVDRFHSMREQRDVTRAGAPKPS